MEEFSLGLLSFLSLTLVSSILYVVSKRINFPYTLFLVLVGSILALLNYQHILNLDFLTHFNLSPEILFYVFLPTLLFEAGYNIKILDFLKSARSIFSLAILGLVISTAFIGLGLYWVLNLLGFQIPLLVTLLFGAIISATDPVAVVALFKEYKTPKRLTLIFEGESMFNDGTAVAMFLVVLGLIESGKSLGLDSIISGTGIFLSMILLGILFGALIGYIFLKLLSLSKDMNYQITIALLSAHTTFFLTDWLNEEKILYISPIVATVVVSLVIGNYGKFKMNPKVEKYTHNFWDYFSFIANSLVFILLGFLLTKIDFNKEALIFGGLAILVAALGRVVSVYLSLAWLKFQKKEPEIPGSWKILLSWGSLRGALAVIMVVMIPDDLKINGWGLDISVKEFITIVVVFSIYFTLFVKGLTIKKLIEKLNILKFDEREEIQFLLGKLVLYRDLKKNLKKMLENQDLSEERYQKISQYFERQVFKIKERLLEKIKETDIKNLRVNIYNYILGIERKIVSELYSYEEISEKAYKKFLLKLEAKEIEVMEKGTMEEFSDLSQYLTFWDKIKYWIKKALKKDSSLNVHDKYFYYKAIQLSSLKVLKALEEIKKLDIKELNQVLDELIERYHGYNQNIKDKLKLLKGNYDDVKEYNKNEVFAFEDKFLNKIKKNQLISEKIESILKQELEEDLKKVL